MNHVLTTNLKYYDYQPINIIHQTMWLRGSPDTGISKWFFVCLFCVCVVIISSLYTRYFITFLYPLPRKYKCSCMKKWLDNKWFWGRPYWPIDKYLFKMVLIFLFQFVHFISETFVRRLWFFVFRKLPRVNIRFFKILLGLLKTRFGTEGWHIFQHTFQKYVS